ncbi:MAG: IPT/TIG domain-containing protein [Acidobacteria bacterium]|nr:IPT/TIG domain-containing protein [Acidobacteriota bacterium]
MSAQSFQVKPKIDSLNPTSGLVGAKVTISGSGFTSTNSVTFAGTAAAFVLVNDFTITATVPPAATTGKINVTTADGTAHSPTQFTVT